MALPIEVVDWTVPVTLDGTYQTVYSLTGPRIFFFCSLWEVSSNDVDVRVQLDGQTVIEANLEDYAIERQLDFPNSQFPLTSYATRRWSFTPHMPGGMPVNGTLTIDMKKSQGNDKTLEWGSTAKGGL
jgi:hypothetical protein